MRISLITLTALFLISCSPSAKEKRENAISKYEEAMRFYSTALTYVQINDEVTQKVISILDESIDADPKFAPSHCGKASMLSRMNKTEEGIEVINSAIKKIGDENVDLLTQRAVLYEKMKQTDRAKSDYNKLIEVFDRTIKVNPEDFLALSNRAVIIALNEDIETGLKELEKIQYDKLNEADMRQFRFLKRTLTENDRDGIIEKMDI